MSECFEWVPPFRLDRPAPPRQLALSKVQIQIQPLVDALIAIVRKGVTRTDLLETFLGRHIQPLQARHHAMWHYAGPSNSTRSHPECVTGETVRAWVRGITGACDNPEGARRVKPFRTDNPPPNEVGTSCRVLSIFLDLSLFLSRRLTLPTVFCAGVDQLVFCRLEWESSRGRGG